MFRDGPALTRFVCGSLAGVIAAFCTYPLDLVRARMAVTQKGRYEAHRFPSTYQQKYIFNIVNCLALISVDSKVLV
jgi:hypothetical protein